MRRPQLPQSPHAQSTATVVATVSGGHCTSPSPTPSPSTYVPLLSSPCPYPLPFVQVVLCLVDGRSMLWLGGSMRCCPDSPGSGGGLGSSRLPAVAVLHGWKVWCCVGCLCQHRSGPAWVDGDRQSSSFVLGSCWLLPLPIGYCCLLPSSHALWRLCSWCCAGLL